ncbi:ABC transporter permease [Paenibacillus cymbidii]|uniref:ABC transporter permease n=1 Tax=Paenibacillus cymbidii TaxID=1639034 RepID=UPI0014366D9C|nr:FtsX-like permease family protein [Paenibacillus cymbidii]
MLRFVLRKMRQTAWHTFAVWVGLTIAVAVAASVPMYASGSLARLTADALKQAAGGLPAGSLSVRYQRAGNEAVDPAKLAAVDEYVRLQLPARIGLPVLAASLVRSLPPARLAPVDPGAAGDGKVRQMELVDRPELAGRIELTAGRLPAASGDAVEAIVYEEALYRAGMRVGDEFAYTAPSDKGNVRLTVRIVGSFRPKDEADPVWGGGADELMNDLVADTGVFEKELMQQKRLRLFASVWYAAYDLGGMNDARLSRAAGALDRLDADLEKLLPHTRAELTFLPLLADIKRSGDKLQAMLFALAAPLLAMVLYAIAMNARQSIERQLGDIAVLRSRGGSKWQIALVFLLEGLLLGALALAAGPWLGMLLAKAIGAANGFLAFQGRKALPVALSPRAFGYGATAVALALAAGLLPALAAARQSIVGYKRKLARTERKPLWHVAYLDVAMLLLAAYGWTLLRKSGLAAMAAGGAAGELQPALFVMPALAIAAAGLFCLRLFPLLVRGLLAALHKRMSVPLYLTLTRLSRSAPAYYPLMLLLVLTLGLGVYNGSAARTIDRADVDRTAYRYGADLVVKPIWESYSEEVAAEGESQQVSYTEPPFEAFRSAPGVAAAARVLQAEAKAAAAGKSLGAARLFGIDNVDFAQTAVFADKLLPHHPNVYLNLLAAYEQAALLSAPFAERYNIKPGDTVTVSYQQTDIEFVVAGIVPYWPTLDPDDKPFLVANLDYIYSQVPLAPYDVWLHMQEGAKAAPVMQALERAQIGVAGVSDLRGALIGLANDPQRSGMFGILSLAFLVAALVTFAGYLLYWTFALSGRLVQFGSLRAAGLRSGQLTVMLLLEQLLTAGTGMALGLYIGRAAVRLYLPFLQTGAPEAQAPPLRIIFEGSDTVRMYAITGTMMAVGATLLVLHIRRIRVHQAVKLGEER